MAYNIYFSAPSIVGSSKNIRHINAVLVASFQLGRPLNPKHRPNRPVIGKFLTLTTDDARARPGLMLAVAHGRHFNNAVLSGEKLLKNGNAVPSFKFVMNGAMLSDYRHLGKGFYEVDMDFATIKIEYGSKKQMAGSRQQHWIGNY